MVDKNPPDNIPPEAADELPARRLARIKDGKLILAKEPLHSHTVYKLDKNHLIHFSAGSSNNAAHYHLYEKADEGWKPSAKWVFEVTVEEAGSKAEASKLKLQKLSESLTEVIRTHGGALHQTSPEEEKGLMDALGKLGEKGSKWAATLENQGNKAVLFKARTNKVAKAVEEAAEHSHGRPQWVLGSIAVLATGVGAYLLTKDKEFVAQEKERHHRSRDPSSEGPAR